MLTEIGVDYDKARSKAEGLTDSEIIEMLQVGFFLDLSVYTVFRLISFTLIV